MAHMGDCWRMHLVHRCGFQFCRLTSPYSWPGRLLFNWTGSNDDLSRMGSVRLEGILLRASSIESLCCLDVRSVSAWAECYSVGSHHLTGIDAEEIACLPLKNRSLLWEA